MLVIKVIQYKLASLHPNLLSSPDAGAADFVQLLQLGNRRVVSGGNLRERVSVAYRYRLSTAPVPTLAAAPAAGGS